MKLTQILAAQRINLPKIIVNSDDKTQLVAAICKHFGIKLQSKLPHKVARQVAYQILQLQTVNKEMLSQLILTCMLRDQEKRRLKLEKRAESRPGFLPHESLMVICHLPAEAFYKSTEWRSLRYRTLSLYGNKCQCCGSTPKDGAKIHVDHIKPRSVFPELSLDPTNMQVLCEDCNLGKSNKHTDDWRGVAK